MTVQLESYDLITTLKAGGTYLMTEALQSMVINCSGGTGMEAGVGGGLPSILKKKID